MAEYIQSKTPIECDSFHARKKYQYESNEDIIENMIKSLEIKPE